MKKSIKLRLVIASLTISATFAVLTSGSFGVRAESRKQVASVIRITPPAPVFDQKERLAELAQRRARVAQSIGPKSLVVLFSTEPRVYTNDVDYQYRQE
ncbi:MAG TPA: aminopeptidase P N-terminal domain-containing protein, partial [Pyrinomonadaceae bacterium]